MEGRKRKITEGVDFARGVIENDRGDRAVILGVLTLFRKRNLPALDEGDFSPDVHGCEFFHPAEPDVFKFEGLTVQFQNIPVIGSSHDL